MKHAISLATLAALWLATTTSGLDLAVSPAVAVSADAEKKGTATCETIDRKILECHEKITYKLARKLCYADRRTKRIHFETNGPTCFEILNGDVEWN